MSFDRRNVEMMKNSTTQMFCLSREIFNNFEILFLGLLFFQTTKNSLTKRDFSHEENLSLSVSFLAVRTPVICKTKKTIFSQNRGFLLYSHSLLSVL